MQDLVKRDIVVVLDNLIEILKKKEDSDIFQIKSLSNQVIHDASVFQDEDSISIAILIYSISKIIERKEKVLDYSELTKMLNVALQNLKSNKEEAFRKSTKSLFSFIRLMDANLKLYIHEVINQAQIKKGCKLCEHGISVARASEVLGISRWELMHYVGKTTLIDQFVDPVNVLQRLKFARSLFA